MKSLSNKLQLVITVMSLVLGTAVTSQGKPSQIEASSKNTLLQVGDPLTLRLVYKYEKPLIKPATGEIVQSFPHYAYLKIEDSEGRFPMNRFPIHPMDLTLKDNLGLEYEGQFAFLYHPGEKRILFPVPGTYKVTVRGYTKTSNPLNITVKPPSKLQKRALFLLSDPNDYFFLEYGAHEDPNKRSLRISRLRQVVEQCEGTIYAKWAAARLGLEYFEDFHKKHPSFIKFKAKLQKNQVEEPLFDKAHMYLSAGAELPDQFPTREKVLYQLVRTQVIKDNYQKAFSLLNELGAKYPKGEYGKRASKGRQELQRVKKRQESQ
jgi:hypothetical protein